MIGETKKAVVDAYNEKAKKQKKKQIDQIDVIIFATNRKTGAGWKTLSYVRGVPNKYYLTYGTTDHKTKNKIVNVFTSYVDADLHL